MAERKTKLVLSNAKLRKALEARLGKPVKLAAVKQINAIVQEVAAQLIEVADEGSASDPPSVFIDALAGNKKLEKVLYGLRLISSKARHASA